MNRTLPTLSLALATILSAGAASAQDADGRWAGPRISIIAGQARGDAAYDFNTDGYFNNAPGDAFTVPVSGEPGGLALGYNWQTGRFVYGIEASILTAIRGVSHWNTDSPYFPGEQNFDLKGHWFTALTGRVGIASDRVMLYAEAGPMLGHLVAEVTDTTNGYDVWTPRAVPGVTLGAGVELAITRRLSLAFGYQMIALAPMHIAAEAIDRDNGEPTGEFTDHDIRYVSHALTAKLVFTLGQDRNVPAGEAPPARNWEGFYLGVFGGALHQIGPQLGYNFRIGERFVAGVEAQASVDFCCGIDFEGDLNGRGGFLLNDDVLLYAEAGVGYLAGSFYGVLDGFFYTAGGGIEIALSPRVSAFMEAKAVGSPRQGIMDGNFQGGFNFHFGR